MKTPRISWPYVSPGALIAIAMLSAAGTQISCAPLPTQSGEEASIPRTQSSGDPLAACTSERNRAVVKLTNQARKDAGLQPVFCSPALAKIAQKHADDMCKLKYFSHTSQDGRTMEDRVDEAKFEFMAIGENLAMGQRTPDEVHTGWMDSPVHRENIVRPVFARLGIGYTACGGEPIWVQNFAN